MNIITNVVKVLLTITILVSIFVPRILGIPTAFIYALMGIVLFALGFYSHVKTPVDTINRAEFYGLAAFLVGTTMMTNDRVHEIISLMAQIGLTMN